MDELSLDDIDALLNPSPYQLPQQTSKYTRWYDKESPCLNRYGNRKIKCGSPTYLKIQGIPLCMKHGIIRLTEILDNKEKETDSSLQQSETS